MLVERATRYTMFCHLPTKDATRFREAFTLRLIDIPIQSRLSLTYNLCKEMSRDKTLGADLSLKVFFCHPHSRWKRVTCESQNDRNRHYLPKGTKLSTVSYLQLNAYQEMLNKRPRRIFRLKSPEHCFHGLISKLPSC